MTRTAVALSALLALAPGCSSHPESPPAEHAAAAAPAQQPIYQCPMHPQIIQHEPGNCPICGMALQRVDETNHVARDAHVPGHAPFTITAERQQLIGVVRAPVEVRPLAREIRTAGTVADDPALYQALVEYREALRTRRVIGQSNVREAHEGARAIVDAAALKLRRLGLDARELALLARGGADPSSFILPGAKVWIYAQVYEEDAALVAPGQAMQIEVPSAPGRTYEATVFALDPVVNPTTRTVRVRALLSTPEAELRPGTYVTVTIRVPLGEQLAIPRDAVLDSGTRRIVFVVTGDGTFTPREVGLGRLAQGYYEVRSGLTAGEQVVTSANFLIDSESRFRAAVAAFGAGGAPAHQH